MRETRSRTSAGPRRFMGGEAMSAYRTAPSLRTLRVSKTLSPAGAAFTCDGSGLVGPEAATGPAAVPLRSRCRGSMSSVSLTVAMPASNAEKIASTEKQAARALRAPRGPSISAWFAQRLERGAHLRNEGCRLFPGREVATLGKVVVVDQLGIRLLRPTARRRIDLVRERAHSHRDLDAPHVKEAARRRVHIVPVKPRRRDRRVCQPIERDVIEHIVARQPLGLAVEDAGDHLLAARIMINHPGCQADWRIDDSVERLWAVVHLDRIAQALLEKEGELIPCMLFFRREAGRRRTADRKRLGNISRNRGRHVGVDADQSRRLLQGHVLGDGVTPVST